MADRTIPERDEDGKPTREIDLSFHGDDPVMPKWDPIAGTRYVRGDLFDEVEAELNALVWTGDRNERE